MNLTIDELRMHEQRAGFHPDSGWSHAAEGPSIRENPASRNGPRPADCRTLQETPEFPWASDAVRTHLSAIELHRSVHGGIIDQLSRDADRLRSQDLASAKLPNPVRKLQDRLRIANACHDFHESLLAYLESLLPEAEARRQEALSEYEPARARIDEGLVELGFAPQLDPRIYTRNRVLIDARNRATFAGHVVDRIREASRHCREQIDAASGEIAFVEGEIRSAVS